MTGVEDFFDKTCTVSRNAPTQDADGAIIQTPAQNAAGIQCAVQIVSPSQRLEPAAGVTEYNVYFAYNATSPAILYGDTLSSIPGLPSMTLVVISEPADDAGEGAYLRVRAKHETGRNAPRE